jgi:hypothetical protein
MKHLFSRWFVVGLLLVAAAVIVPRLYHLSAPIADWHSFRQVDTAAVARNFAAFGFDPFRPRYEDLSNIQSGKDNPMGWRMVEFPLYQSTAYILSGFRPAMPIEWWLRIVSIASAVATALILVLLVADLVTPASGIVVGLCYALLPYSIYYGRTTLPETFGVFLAVASLGVLYCGTMKQERRLSDWGLYMLSGALGAAALLVKPPAAFLLLPGMVFIWRKYRVSIQFILGLVLYGAICLLPLLWWRHWILQYPEGIAAYDWLLNSNGIRFKGAWFYWLFAERIGNLILGYWGLIPLGLGLVASHKKGNAVFGTLLLGSLAYLVIFATGNVQHDYYQVFLLPALSIFTGLGLVWLVTTKAFPPVPRMVLALAVVLFGWSFSWYTIRTYYWINRPDIITAGQAADALLPKDAKVIAPYNGDTTFLYQTKRQGWPIGFDIDKKIAMGATTYVTVSPTDADFETKDLAEKYTVLVRNERFAIIDLTKPKRVK